MLPISRGYLTNDQQHDADQLERLGEIAAQGEAELREIAIQEATELVEQLTQSLTVLGRDTSATDTVEVVFRAAHTLRGVARQMGGEYEGVDLVATGMEDLLAPLRKRVPLRDRCSFGRFHG